MNLTRRAVIDKVFKGSVLALGFSVAGTTLLLTPEQARAQKVPLRKLSDAQVKTLEALGEAMVPGSVALGLTHFVDHQLAAEPGDCLLIAKYLQAPLPYSDFYGNGLKVADAMAQKIAGKPVAALEGAALEGVVKEMSKGGAVVDGFPIFLFYMCLRSDAVDVVYGTPAGFEKLNIPYMEHIKPPEGWNG
jgi:hypothetical protein